jgi:hypothetical protein
MPFMEAELTEKKYWLAIDGDNGIDYVPDDLFAVQEVRDILKQRKRGEDCTDSIFALVKDYTENLEARSAELVFGYGVRSTAPGYLDCTAWTVYTNLREATKAYNEEKRECR